VEGFAEIIAKTKNPFPEILGQEKAKKAVLSALIARRHLVILGFPGVGKTTMARSVAKLLPEIRIVKGCEFSCDPAEPVCPNCLRHAKGEKLESTKSPGAKRFIRVQGSPDLQAEDLLGDIDPIKALEFGPRDPRAFTPGKILRAHRGVLFFDEINRCPERLQNALLQVLEEGKVTIGGYEVDYPTDFILIATMNPKESAGTEKLSEALLDRFDVVEMTYPEDAAIEKEIMLEKAGKFSGVSVPDEIIKRIVSIVRATRTDERIERPAGVRATIGLFERVQTNAIVSGRKTARTEDIISVVHSVLDHRIKLAPKFRHSADPAEIVDSIVKKETATPEKPPPEKEDESSDSEPPRFSENPSKIPEKNSKSFGPLLRQMSNRGIGGVSAVFVARSIVYDISSAIGTFGEELLSGLTGLPIAELSRSEGKIEKVSQITDRIESNLKLLRSQGYIMREGGLSRKALEAVAEETLKDELEILSKLGSGSHAARAAGFDEKGDHAIPFSKGHSYKRISTRKTVGMAIRRGHSRPQLSDLRSREMTRKSGVDFVFVLDSSGSMRAEKIDACKRAAIGLAAVSVGTMDRVAVISFRKEPEVICEFSDSEDLPVFAEKIVAITPGGTTSIAKALSLATGMLIDLASPAAKHILLITDALPTEGDKPAEEAKLEAEKAADSGVTISVAGISLTEEGEELAREISGIGSGNFYNVPAGDLTALVLDDRAKLSASPEKS
jgi:magnesium chelatase subunit I